MSTPTRGRGRGTKAIAAPRGRGRRTDADRARLLQEESERTKARETEHAAEVAARARDEARRKKAEERRSEWRRGRGGFMGDRGGRASGAGLSGGGISSFAPSKTQFKGKSSHTGQSGTSSRPRAASGPVRIKSEPGTEVGTPFSNTDSSVIMLNPDDGYVSSDQDDGVDAPRQDIDTINLADADDDVEYLGTSSKKTLRARPMRLVHRPHQDRAIQIDTEAGGAAIARNAANAQNQTYVGYQSSAAPKGTRPVWRGAWADSEDDDDDGIVPGGFVDRETDPEDEANEGNAEPKSQRVKRKISKQAFQTVEDRLEYERAVEKAQIMSIELAQNPSSRTAGTDDDGAADTEEANDREGRVYLFQFPPDMPDLRRVDGDSSDNPEPSTNTSTNGEAPSQPQPATTNGNSENVIVKSEDDDADQKAALLAKEAEDTAPTQSACAQWNLPDLPAGHVGKLRLHKSGKVTIDWAGHAYNVNLGLQASCVQEMVMLDVPAEKTVEPAGAAIPFGQVRGKYVVTPDWDKILPTWRKYQLSKKD